MSEEMQTWTFSMIEGGMVPTTECDGQYVTWEDATARISTLERELAEAKETGRLLASTLTVVSNGLTAANATIAACKEAGFVTADGVIALPGTFVYAKWWGGNVVRGFVRHEFHGNESCCFVEMTTTTDDGRTIGVRTFLSDCYSTREAAAAKEAQ